MKKTEERSIRPCERMSVFKSLLTVALETDGEQLVQQICYLKILLRSRIERIGSS